MGVQYRLGAIDGNCGWCGDFGENSSFLPAEKAKVIAAKFSVKVSIKEGNIPCSNFSYSDLECIVDRWTAEELENMDTQDLLSETGEKDPEAAIDMMKLLLDTVGDKLQEREVAYQFLGWDMDGLLEGSVCPWTTAAAAENRRLSGQADLPVCLPGHRTEDAV